MSEGFAAPPPPGAPPTRVRPGTVTIANLLLLVVAAVYLIGFFVAVSVIGTMRRVFEEEFAGTDAEGAAGLATAAVTGVSFVNLLIAVGIVVLVVFNSRGSNPARIVTWVLGGIGLCCNGLGLLSSGLSVSGGTQGGVDQARLEQRLEDALPSWYGGAELTILLISVAALAVALVLLALPPSNEFFRKRAQPFAPPPGYPPPSHPPVG
jgi:hypothetical protein